MAGTQDAEAMSAYLTDLQNPIRAPGARLAAVTRVLSEPLSFLGMEYLRGHGHGHAPASANTHAQAMAPNWAGPLAPTTARRSYFIQHLLPSHLEFLLDNVTINWLSALPSTQQTYLFDGSFVPTASLGSGQEKMGQEDQEQTEARCMMAVVSLQTLVSKVQGRQFQENHSFLNSTVLRLLKKLIVTYSMKEFYAGCLTMAAGKSSPNADTGVGGYSRVRDDTLWDSFLSRLFSIPTRVSNALGGNAPTRVDVEECFREEEFFRKQTVQLQMCLGNLGAKHDGDVDTEQEAKAFGIVVTKFLRLGYGRTLIESVVSTLWGREPTDDDPKAKGWKLALTRVSSTGTVQLFLTTLVDYLNGHQLNFRSSGGGRKIGTNTTNTTIDSKCTTSQEEQVSAVHRGANLLVSIGFGTQEVNNILKSSKSNSDQGESNNALVDEVLFQGRIFGIGVLRMLVCIQSGWPTGVRSDKDSALARSFKKALEIWSDTMLVSHASTEYQRYVSYQVLLMVGYFNVQVLIEADLIPIFSVGVSSWLEMESFQRKQIGLIVAEEFSRAVDTIGAPADFDLDSSDPEIQFSRSLVQLKDGSQPYTPTREPSRSSSDGTENIRTEEAAVQEESDDEYDPDELEDGFTRASTYKGESSGEEDEDEKDGLKPYAMEYESDPDEDVGSVKKAKVAAPLYLRDLVSYLRAGEDRDKIEIGLRSAAELIRRKAGSLELEEFAEELANALVQLMDNFDLTNFYKLRESALVALVVTSPVSVSGVLTFQFYEKKNSLGQRLNILTALALGAQELSGFDRPPTGSSSSSSSRSTQQAHPYAASTTTAASSASTLVAQQRPVTFDSITSGISLARTRRFSQKSQIEASRPTPKASAFSNLAPVFLGGLLGRWGGNRGAGRERGYDVLQKAPAMVLKKFVVTLGVLVHYAGNSPHLLSITKELFRFLLALRYHTPPTQPTPGPRSSGVSSSPSLTSLSNSTFMAPSLTSLKVPGDIGISTGLSTSNGGVDAGRSLSTLLSAGSLPYNPDMLESILFDLLILVTPSSAAIPDSLLLNEFYAEIMECQQWTMELWEFYKLEPGSSGGGDGDKARIYCAALLQRCFELLQV